MISQKKMIATINIKLFKIIAPVEFFFFFKKKKKDRYVVTGIFCALLAFIHFLFGTWGI